LAFLSSSTFLPSFPFHRLSFFHFSSFPFTSGTVTIQQGEQTAADAVVAPAKVCDKDRSGFDRCVTLRDQTDAVATLFSSSQARFILVMGMDLMCQPASGSSNLSLGLLNRQDAEELAGSPLEDAATAIFLGKLDGAPLFVFDLPKAESWLPAPGLELMNARTHAPLLSTKENAVALAACAVTTWHRRSKFCAGCGGKTVVGSSGHMQKCEECGTVSFPRQDPAVITVVSSRDRSQLLLANSPRHHPKMFTALAGFVEAGETLEECVAREVHEETGVVVDPGSISYLKSQPWPFPQSYMAAFIATADHEAALNIDREELVSARWYDRSQVAAALTVESAVMDHMVAQAVLDERPELELLVPPPNVVARELIEAWLESPPGPDL
jgi:NAD+ diphosphatase